MTQPGTPHPHHQLTALQSLRPRSTAPPAVLMSVEDAADALGIGRTKVYELLKARMLRSVTIGRRRLVPLAEVQRFAEELMSEQAAS